MTPVRKDRRAALGSQHVLYISDVLPFPDTSGGRVMRRHFSRLAQDGNTVTVAFPPSLAGAGSNHAAGYSAMSLPKRRWWWPPTRAHSELSKHIRAVLWARSLNRSSEWRLTPPSAVLTVLWGHLSTTALLVARAWNIPLVVIVHDLFAESKLAPAVLAAHERSAARILRAASRVLVVSEEMRQALQAKTTASIEILAPMPDYQARPGAGWEIRHRARPIVVHAGLFHATHAQALAPLAGALERAGGELVIITPPDNPSLGAFSSMGAKFRVQPAFPRSDEALRFIAQEASGVAVGFPFATSGAATPTGFPSRLVELSHLGLPIVCIGSPNNPLQTWARRNGWPLRIEDPNNDSADAAVAALAHEPTWRELSARLLKLAAGEFNPENIHRNLCRALFPSHPAPLSP